PDRDRARRTVAVVARPGKRAGNTFEIGKHPIAPFMAQGLQLCLEERVVIHLLGPIRERSRRAGGLRLFNTQIVRLLRGLRFDLSTLPRCQEGGEPKVKARTSSRPIEAAPAAGIRPSQRVPRPRTGQLRMQVQAASNAIAAPLPQKADPSSALPLAAAWSAP